MSTGPNLATPVAKAMAAATTLFAVPVLVSLITWRVHGWVEVLLFVGCGLVLVLMPWAARDAWRRHRQRDRP